MMNTASLLIMNLKASFAVICSIILAFLLPIIPLLLIVGAAIFLDTIFGIIKAKKMKDPITSRKLSKIISKMVLYQSAIVLFFCIEKYILSDVIGLFCAIPLMLTKLVTTTLLFIEGKSVNENYQAISGVSIWGSLKNLIARTKEIKGDITDITKKD